MNQLFKRDNLLTMRFMNRLSWIFELKEYLAKMNNLPKYHGAGPPEARGPQRRGTPRGAGPPEARGPQRRGAPRGAGPNAVAGAASP